MKRDAMVMWRSLEERHREKVQRKVERIGVLRALVEMHEADPNHDHEYLVGLRGRMRSAEANLNAMKPLRVDRE